jgi:hypothetical protein
MEGERIIQGGVTEDNYMYIILIHTMCFLKRETNTVVFKEKLLERKGFACQARFDRNLHRLESTKICTRT